MKKEDFEKLVDDAEQNGLRIVEITKRKREVSAQQTMLYSIAKLNQREADPFIHYDEVSSLAYGVICRDEEYQALRVEQDALEDEGNLLAVDLEKQRSIILLEMIERSAEAFPLQLLSTKLRDFQ